MRRRGWFRRSDRFGMKIRNPFKRVARSIRKHGVASTAKMAYQLSMRTLPHLIPNSRLKWADLRYGGVVIRDIQGSRMKLDLSDEGISRELYLTGVHEPHSTRQFREELKPGMVLLEIGANIGYYALVALQHLGPKGSIVALEPSPVNLRALSENLRLNRVDGRVKVYPYAAGREPGRLPFYVIPRGNQSTFIMSDEHNKPTSVTNVDVMTIDELLKEENAKVDCFRMDVEGFEVEVVEGMVETLTGVNGPVGAFIEMHPSVLKKSGSSGCSFVARMEELGYRIKIARYIGRNEHVVYSNSEFFTHPLRETSNCWEAFFVRCETRA